MEDRLAPFEQVWQGGIRVCCGVILGIGEAAQDRIAMLATLPAHPDSVPVRRAHVIDPLALVRIVALARILMPVSVVRLSAERIGMHDEVQACAFSPA